MIAPTIQPKQFGLRIRPGVVLTDSISAGIKELDAAYAKGRILGEVTSGLRTEEQQLQVIKDKARKAGITHEFSFFYTMTLKSETMFEDSLVFEWQIVWSRLMNLDYDINPPYPAKLLMDRMKYGINKKGKLYPKTEHAFGISFDVEGRHPLTDEVMLDEYTDGLLEAMNLGKTPSIVSYTKEAVNVCLHVNCKLVT